MNVTKINFIALIMKNDTEFSTYEDTITVAGKVRSKKVAEKHALEAVGEDAKVMVKSYEVTKNTYAMDEETFFHYAKIVETEVE